MYGLVLEPEDTDAFDDLGILARTAYGEARGEGREGMHAVLNSVQNRLASGRRWWGTSYRTICLAPYQYSCWLHGDPNRPKLLSVDEKDPQYIIAMELAADALAGALPDLVAGADSYFAPGGCKVPKWAAGHDPAAIIGRHWFYRTV